MPYIGSIVATQDPDAGDAITIRYQMTAEGTRAALLLVGVEWLPWLVGLIIVALLGALWSPLGEAGHAAAVLVPLLLLLWVGRLMARNRRRLAIYRGRTIELVLDGRGLRFDAGFAQTQMPWTTVRRIVRGRKVWVFDVRTDSRFYIPTDAIPVEIRGLIARWASQNRVRLA